MKMIAGFTFALVLLSSAAAAGQITGTWSTKEGCDRLEKDPSAIWAGNPYSISYLTKNGVNGYEWGCEFGDASTTTDGKTTAYLSKCSQQGSNWTSFLLVEKANKGWSVTLVYNAPKDAETEDPVMIYDHRCT